MTKREWVRASAFIVWRAFQATVVVPASILGAAVLVFTLFGEAPVRAMVEKVFVYADNEVRRAQPGSVISQECLALLPAEKHRERPAPICGDPREVEVPISNAVDSTLHALASLYIVLLALACMWVAGMHPGRRFFGLPPSIH